MKKALLVVATIVLVASCYNDSAVWNKLNDHEARLVKLELLCNQLNTDISSLQSIVSVLQSLDYVTSILPLIKDGEEIGYTITFAKNKAVVIHHGTNGKDGKDGQDGKDGKDGKDGSTPMIGIKLHADGNYYWTLNGSWLLDASGNMIPANGKDGADGQNGQDGKDGADGKDGQDGKDGITPKLKIEDGYWYLSTDGGASWQRLSKAVGEDGKDGDSFFSSVTQDDTQVTLVLKDGTTINIPKQAAMALELVFETTEGIFCDAGSTTTVSFKIEGGEVAQIYALGENGWTGTVVADNKTKTGTVTIVAPATPADGKLLIFATDTYGHLIMKALTFTDKMLEVADDSFTLPKEGGTFEVKIATTLNYTVRIPSAASSWLSLLSTKAVRNEVLMFEVAANGNTSARNTTVTIECEDKAYSKTIVVYQDGDRFYASGSGTAADPYVIATTGQWTTLASVVANGNTFSGQYFKLGNDLDFNGATIDPMGDETFPFSGSFDADGKTISNARISGSKNLGLFGYIKKATLSNFKASSITVSGTSYMGVLAGYASESTIKDANVSGNIDSGSDIGGIVGYAQSTKIDGCKNGAKIGNTSSQYAGGIAGYCAGSHISNSVNSGRMTGYDCMGGIAGYVDASSSLKNCYNDAQFTQGSLYGSIGGVVGYNCGTLCACVNNSTINGTVQLGWCSVGLIVGYNHTDAVGRYCYFLKYSILNKNFNICGDLDWGTWYNSGAYDSYGRISSGAYATNMLNQWVEANSTASTPYRRWSGTYPRFAE
jgi:hypothetical protein